MSTPCKAVLIVPYLVIALLLSIVVRDRTVAWASPTLSSPMMIAPAHLCGLYRGIVQSNADPEHRNRLKVDVPVARVSGLWALPGSQIGSPPAAGSEIWVLFENGSANYPVWLASPPAAR